MDALPPRRTMLDAVYAAIRDSICLGELPPGERITQDDIADRLSVSRQPVGQALILLKEQGFVSETGRRGVRVAPLDAEMVREIYEIRGALDALAAGLAAGRAGKSAIEKGRGIVDAGRRAAEGSEPVRDLVKADMAFHDFIYGLAGNRLIRQSLDPYWHHLRRVMAGVVDDRDYRKVLWREHGKILDAIAEGDAAAAAELSRRHVEAASTALQAKLANRLAAES